MKTRNVSSVIRFWYFIMMAALRRGATAFTSLNVALPKTFSIHERDYRQDQLGDVTPHALPPIDKLKVAVRHLTGGRDLSPLPLFSKEVPYFISTDRGTCSCDKNTINVIVGTHKPRYISWVASLKINDTERHEREGESERERQGFDRSRNAGTIPGICNRGGEGGSSNHACWHRVVSSWQQDRVTTPQILTRPNTFFLCRLP